MGVFCTAHSAFRVSSENDSGCSHVLQANDELDKRHWLQCIDEARSREVLPIASAKLCSHSNERSSTDTLCADFQSPTDSGEERSAAAGYDEGNESDTVGTCGKLTSVTSSSSLRVSKRILDEL